jgi:hypothetical protein
VLCKASEIFQFWEEKLYFFNTGLNVKDKNVGKAIPVTDCGSSHDCEMSRMPHFLDKRLTDGGEVVSLMHPRMIPSTCFC